MALPKKTNNLGRGLGSLIAGAGFKKPEPAAPAAPAPKAAVETPAPKPEPDSPFREIPVAKIVPAKWQPRREFSPEAIAELADSIRAEGLIQPVTVRKAGGDGYELIAGERRWRAFQSLGIKTIPARIITASDAGSAAMTLIENLQRENLNPLEEALGYASLMRDFALTQDAVAERVGKPRATVANTVRLLSLDRDTQGYLVKGLLSAGHAKVLLSLEIEAMRPVLARKAVEQGLSVRQLEQEVKKARLAAVEKATAKPEARSAAATAAIMDIEKKLVSRFNTKVRVKHGSKRGLITIEYYGNDDLSRILDKIGVA